MPGVGDDARALPRPSTRRRRIGQRAEDRLRAVLRTVVSQTADAEEIFILDLDGAVRLSTLADHEGASQADEPFFATGSSHTTVQNAYRSSLTNLPTITVATPLFDQDGGGRRVAVIAANLSLQRVDRIVLERTGLGETGQAYLVGADGRLIQGLTTRDGGVRHSVAVDEVSAGRVRQGTLRRPPRDPRRRRLPLAAGPRRRAHRRDDPGRSVRVSPPAGPHDRPRRSGVGPAAGVRDRARRAACHEADPRPGRHCQPGPGRRPPGDVGRPIGRRGRDARGRRSRT